MTETATRSRENTRARLVEAASLVFAESGVEGASVEAICERAGFTRGAFYSNFGSKAELLFALVQQLAEEKVARIGVRVREMDVDGPGRLGPAEVVAQVREIAAENRATVVLMNELRVQAMRDAELARAYLALEDAMNERIAEIITDIVRIHGLRLRLPALEAARLLQMNWNATAALAAIARLDDADAQRLLTERTATLAAALAEGDADG
ncbi:TetR/AcrR family transcriptional regulator [Microbacterium sp. SORGH_AS_0888]|uniref:TetR/AcrR family transcriptional regulator n=1 Tax=Microbacterium sp. SORGH_AS_0888 TaxID=3041791 RepID=UPI002785C979|nr:TetR/AcrR family transcriptional regulator [Microbacterium sp. SORGH_AS_0888]MDQ1130644.1 AcrR family transcriptional regulator [Microbacterium sp. SORGH_AS_0888]